MTPEVPTENDDIRRYETLMKMADLMVHHSTLPELFELLASRLSEVTCFHYINFALYDPIKHAMRVHLWNSHGLSDDTLLFPVSEYPSGWVWQHQEALTIPDLSAVDMESGEMNALRNLGLRSHCILPLSTSEKRLGALGVGSVVANIYPNGGLRLLQSVAQLVALAVENELTRKALREESGRRSVLREVSRTLNLNEEVSQLFPAVSASMQKTLRHDYASINILDETNHMLRRYAVDRCDAVNPIGAEPVFPMAGLVNRDVFVPHSVDIHTRQEMRERGLDFPLWMVEDGIETFCCVPLFTQKKMLGTLNLGYKHQDAFSEEYLSLLPQVASQLSSALDNAQAHKRIAELSDKLATEKIDLEIRSESDFAEIIGDSAGLSQLLGQTKIVAPSDATVLILGETGTGKELVARAIHRLSLRKDASFIKLNCAAIPTGLLESEIFGHERGAFTGAVSQKIGRLELAHKGTLFLDEIGDINPELQPKLLRVLQDQEFERLGGTRTIRVDVRLVAATNRDLAKSVTEREFRSDLYYRLNVFPIRMPALRERRQDIPMLVRYFVQQFSRRMRKQIEEIPTEAMSALVHWDWPGNIRELENFIERSVILTEGSTLRVAMAELSDENRLENDGTLESIERDHIVQALKNAGGVIAGHHGAAARLGLKRTTLQSKMQRMGILRSDYEESQ